VPAERCQFDLTEANRDRSYCRSGNRRGAPQRATAPSQILDSARATLAMGSAHSIAARSRRRRSPALAMRPPGDSGARDVSVAWRAWQVSIAT